MTSVRFNLHDTQGAAYSDFDLAEAINRAMRMLYSSMARRLINTALKKTILIVEDGATTLPSDYAAINNVKNENGEECHPTPHPVQKQNFYRIYGNNFEAVDGTYTIEYFQLPLRMKKSDDALDAPESLREPLVDMATVILGGDIGSAASVAEQCCDNLAANNISHYCDFGPVEIYGGKL